jgi:hypothetical protein
MYKDFGNPVPKYTLLAAYLYTIRESQIRMLVFMVMFIVYC